MGSDNRDWYRDWWRKKTGYVERASFRMGERERVVAKRRADLRQKRLGVLAFFLFLVLFWLLR